MYLLYYASRHGLIGKKAGAIVRFSLRKKMFRMMLLVAVITLAFATSASAGTSAAAGLSDLIGAESQIQAPAVFRGALGEMGELYANHVNYPADAQATMTLS
ncbi:MAG TPA: hypothetical protein PKZ39_02980, partial [Clostridia bacterium]|nr:hypothetical protein [Clostridia bacterium]